jgi:ribosomal protein S14
MFVLHKCDNPKCINPNHLFLGDQFDNMRDCALKKRTYFGVGENNPRCKLTISQVREIRRYLSCGVKQGVIAKKFNISQSQVRRINKKINWI